MPWQKSGNLQSGSHAGEIETSVMLLLDPDRTDMARALNDYGAGARQDYGGYRPGLCSGDPADPAY